jgi:hypothetical protein
MKAEERHRLQENELRRFAEHARERSRPFFDRYGTALLLGLAAILVLAAIAVWWFKSRGTGDSASWEALAIAFRKPDASAQQFADVAELYPGTSAGLWAKLYEGESHLDSGIQSLFSDKEGATRDLEDARAAYEAVLDQGDAGSELTVRALYGLARTLEASSDGDLKPAIDRYEQIVEQYEGTVYEALARDRVAALKSPDATSFYKWFATAKPTLTDPLARPQDRGMPALPNRSGPVLPGVGAAAPGSPAAPVEAPRPTPAAAESSPEAAPSGAAGPDDTTTDADTPADGAADAVPQP